MSRVLVAVVLLASPLAGCLGDAVPAESVVLPEPEAEPVEAAARPAVGSASSPSGNVSGAAAPPAVPPVVRRVLGVEEDGALRIEVPLRVVLAGFEPGVAEALSAASEPFDVEQVALSSAPRFPLSEQRPREEPGRVPVVARVVPEVVAAPEAFFAETMGAASRAVEGGPFDASALEAAVAAALDRHGLAPPAGSSGLVVFHAGDALDESHTWRYTLTDGWLDGVRIFGGKHPFLVADVSALPDPWVVGRPNVIGDALGFQATGAAYDFPLARSGDGTVDALGELVRDAASFRLAQGSIYPVSTAPCHAVTLVLAVRGAAATEALPGYTKAEQQADLARVAAAFQELAGSVPVHVDLTVLRLPVDDPELEVVLRSSTPLTPASDAARWWLATNWERYWVAHEGCEAYVSLLLYGDAADSATVGSSHGIAMYDVAEGRRISFSYVDEIHRLESEGPLAPLYVPPASGGFEWMPFLFTHETGHLLGQRHPHDISVEDGAERRFSFSSTWTSMSYQTEDRLLGFGAVDGTNWARNRAGYALQAAVEAGLADSPEFARAIERLDALDWAGAADVLVAATPR